MVPGVSLSDSFQTTLVSDISVEKDGLQATPTLLKNKP